MIGKEIYKIWAPCEVKWSSWVRPVSFVQIDNVNFTEHFKNYIPHINYLTNYDMNTAIIVDLPSYDSVNEGIALAKLGYRPIPLYNGANGQAGSIATVDNTALELSLIWGSKCLKRIKLKNDALPAFLLDSNRTNRFKMSDAVYDNSWDIYSQDVPSAKYLLENGVNYIVLRSDKIRKDILKILYSYYKEGIEIFYTEGYDKPRKIKIRKPKKDINE